jgi:glutaredoxin
MTGSYHSRLRPPLGVISAGRRLGRVRCPAVRHVVMYSRPGCGLCDEAREVILAERGRTGFEFDEVDVSGDDTLELEYGIRIPVVLVDGEERFEIHVERGAFARAVRD